MSLLVTLALGSVANAAFIQGVINFTGEATFDLPMLTATQVTSWTSTEVETPITDDFAAYVSDGDPVTFNAPWSFNSGALAALWSTGGFTFDLDWSSIDLQAKIGLSEYLVVSGAGTVSGNGFDPTPGTWSFTSQYPGKSGSPNNVTQFSFSSTTVATPDGGTSIALLGLSLCGLGLLRRKL
jgi:hypothetical protein